MTKRPSRSGIRYCMQFVAFVLSIFAMLPAVARQGDRSQIVQSQQDALNGFYSPNSITTLTGHVLITQGSTKLSGNLATLYLGAAQELNRAVVTGKPAHIEQQNDNNELMTGDAAQLDYNNISGMVVLTGHAIVNQQGHGEIHGDKLTYNTQTYQVIGQGNTRMTLLPKQKFDRYELPTQFGPSSGATLCLID